MLDVNKLLESKAYDFLRTNEHLKDRIVFLCLGGSHSYGTNIETSDVDIRGVALDTKLDVLGVTNFEQFQNTETDTTIYSLSKFIKLVCDCNPNIIEMLFCKPEHYYWVSPIGKMLLENRDMFLSKKAFYTFGGYAHAQLNRLENALVRNGDILTEEETQIHINRSVKNAMMTFQDKYGIPEECLKTYVGQSKDNGKYEILLDINAKGLPFADFKSSICEMTNILRDYEKTVGQRNKKKDDVHLNKHMMHLIRLYFMCNEILKDKTLHTFREKEHVLLMDIRNGKFRTNDSGVKPEFYDLLNSLESEANELYSKSSLQKQVDKMKVAELLVDIYTNYIFNKEVK